MKNWQKKTIAAACAALVSAPALALEAGDWLVRVGPTWVVPNDDSGAVAPLELEGVEVGSDVQLGASLTYMLTERLGVEVLAATPFSHSVSSSGALAGVAPGQIAEVTHLPPTVTLQYHFDLGHARPYLGAGLNYTTFFDEKLKSDALQGMNYSSVSLSDSFSYALQAGVDVPLQKGWFLNAALWYVDLDTTARIRGGDAGTLEVDVDINPWVVMLGGGRSF